MSVPCLFKEFETFTVWQYKLAQACPTGCLCFCDTKCPRYHIQCSASNQTMAQAVRVQSRVSQCMFTLQLSSSVCDNKHNPSPEPVCVLELFCSWRCIRSEADTSKIYDTLAAHLAAHTRCERNSGCKQLSIAALSLRQQAALRAVHAHCSEGSFTTWGLKSCWM
jgi:hypothetical protein